ncbi:MAG: hypothetical protein PVF18_11975, partial [Anaerolineales bacterium]
TRVQVTAENPVTGQCSHTNTAYLVYVALNDKGKPIPVPELIAESELEKKRMQEAAERQAYRLSQRELASEG